MKKIQIHGKDYVMVKDRIIFFNENFPNGSITTELKATENSFIFKAKITPDVENPSRKFTGHAEEIIGSSQINKTYNKKINRLWRNYIPYFQRT